LCFCFAAAALNAQTPELIREIRVHGNHTTPDADILSIAGLTTGEPADEGRLLEAERRLRESGRFADVEVRRRFRSIEDPSEILIMLVVDEHDAVSADDLSAPGPMARIGAAQMWLPILNYADGYGFTYGARASFVEPLGKGSRLSVPMSWGGERKIGVELDLPAEAGSHIRGVHVRFGASINRRVNPHFDTPDLRREATAQAEKALLPWLRAGATGRVSRVSFGIEEAWHRAAGAQLTVDTRIDPSFPRNAAHLTLGVERLGFGARGSGIGEGGSAARVSVDGRGYIGLLGSSVLAVRAAAVRASDPLPPSEQLLVGGGSTLRGYRAGHLAGDGLALLSAEVRVPLTSPLSYGRFGVKAFMDAATTWDAGTKLGDRRFDRGLGGGVYFGATAVQANVDVAWPERGKPRVHVALGVSF
jgi:outer membrane protein assembly factor BamA